MPLFGPPNIEKLKTKHDVKGLIKALTYREDPKVRVDAASALGMFDTSEIIEPLVAALKDDEWSVRSSAEETLQNIKNPQVTESLITVLKDNDWDVRTRAIRLLGDWKNPRILFPLIDALEDGDVNVRSSAAKALGKLGDLRAIEPLISVAKKDNNIIAFGPAIEALGKLGGEKSIAALVDILGDEWLQSGDNRRSSAVNALVSIGEPAVAPVIQVLYYKQYKRDEDDVWINAIYVLRDIGSPKAVEAIANFLFRPGGYRYSKYTEYVIDALEKTGKLSERILRYAMEDASTLHYAALHLSDIPFEDAIYLIRTALRDANPDVRKAALSALGASSNPQAVELIKTALRDTNKEVREKALTIIERLDTTFNSETSDKKEYIYQQFKRLTSDDPIERVGAADKLGRMQDKRAGPALLFALNDDYDEVRHFAAIALGMIGDTCAVDHLIRALKDKSVRGRLGAAIALGQLGDERAIDLLNQAVKEELSSYQSSNEVVEALNEALKQIEARTKQ